MIPEATLIISFYNKIRDLKLVFAGLERQSITNFEVIIADDGSREEVVREVKILTEKSRLNAYHIWHEDHGWRKNMILNQGLARSQGQQIIFIDGDCIPHRHFVKEHIINARSNLVLAGRRVYLGRIFSKKLTPAFVKEGKLESLTTHLFNQSWHAENSIYLPGPVRLLIPRKTRGVLGSNFSVTRKDLIDINGFDERYSYPSVGEDTDLEYRLLNNGAKIKSLKFLAIQYHIWHPKLSRKEGYDENLSYLKEVRKQKVTSTPYGIRKN